MSAASNSLEETWAGGVATAVLLASYGMMLAPIVL